MNENEIIMEQPVVDTDQSFEQAKTEKGIIDSNNGSILGKFKSVESLASAYTNLHSEFTKKSQRLKELEKSDNLEAEVKIVANNNADLETDNVNASSSINISETKNQIKDTYNVTDDYKPQYSNDDWSLKVTKFLNENPHSKIFSRDIAEILTKDKDLANMPNSLELAYNKVLASKYKNENDLANDEEFLNKYIVNNVKVQQKIINKYLEKINTKNVPTLIANVSGAVGVAGGERPKNLDDAKKIMERMLKNK